MRRRPSLVALLLALTGAPLAGQAVSRAADLERLGRWSEAAAAYRATLASRPADEAALLGLERVLPRLGRLPELVSLARRARQEAPGSDVVRGVELRVVGETLGADSLAAVARAWVAATPGREAPYREWAMALADQGRYAEARAVLVEGRARVGRPAALAVELAEVQQRAGEWPATAREWAGAVAATPPHRANAVYQLGEAPLEQRDAVLAELTSGGPAGRRVAAELLVVWGRPLDGWRVLETTLADASAETAAALRDFAERAAAARSADHLRARGLALAAYADRVPPPLAVRVRGEAARALLDAGDRAAARRVLERLLAEGAAAADARGVAEAALIELLIDDGALDDAGARLATAAPRLTGEDAATLRHRLARARVAAGALAAADSLLALDSSVAATAIRGWSALYRGELAAAESLFRRAGPYAGDRADATARTAVLALIAGIEVERAPALGQALHLLARGDSAAAPAALRAAAASLGPAGRAAVLLLAGRVAARPGGDAGLAASLLAEAVATDPAGPSAPGAELEWARVLARTGRTTDAIAKLEHLILTYPESAFAPEARRELERVRGAVPRS